jgi:hypothetical protein
VVRSLTQARVAWWDTDALTFLYPLKGVCAATIISIVGLIANFNIKHEGTWKNFKCDANIKRGKEIIKANMKTSIGSKFNWQASIETPIVMLAATFL